MATKFKKGDVVEVRTAVPKGPVLALRMDEDGNVFCLVQWEDADGVTHERWFEESVLTAGA